MPNGPVPAAATGLPKNAALRRRMAKAIDLLIAAMDELDGDADLEAGGDDELTLGAPENHPPYVSSQGLWGQGKNLARFDDCEVENEHGGDVNDEPHDEDFDMEPDADTEPSLGWSYAENQDIPSGSAVHVDANEAQVRKWALERRRGANKHPAVTERVEKTENRIRRRLYGQPVFELA